MNSVLKLFSSKYFQFILAYLDSSQAFVKAQTDSSCFNVFEIFKTEVELESC